jgi:prolyl-tRNA synthetase
MGCYGIGVSRVIAAAIEQHNDENGIIFPLPMAPYQVMVLPIDIKHGNIMEVALGIYHTLKGSGIDALIDDRDIRPGVKFKDADLLGVPYRITVGAKGLAEGVVEINERATGKVEKLPPESITRFIQIKLKDNGLIIDCTDK